MALEYFAASARSERSTISARRHRNAYFLGIVRRTKPFLYVDSGSQMGSASGLLYNKMKIRSSSCFYSTGSSKDRWNHCSCNRYHWSHTCILTSYSGWREAFYLLAPELYALICSFSYLDCLNDDVRCQYH